MIKLNGSLQHTIERAKTSYNYSFEFINRVILKLPIKKQIRNPKVGRNVFETF